MILDQGPYAKLTEKNKQMQVVIYILQHTDAKTKIFSRTYNQIQKDTKVSQPTIAKVLKVMQKNGAMEYLGDSRWRVPMVLDDVDVPKDPDYYYVHNKGP